MEGNEMSRLENTFRAPKGVRQFKTITVAELDGNMERDAAHMADLRIASEKIKTDDVMARFRIEREEDIRASIVAVDEKPVEFPFQGFDGWPKKVRQVVVARFHDAMNSIDTDDLDLCVSEVMVKHLASNDLEVVAIGAHKGG
jgi:hypothetical protein